MKNDFSPRRLGYIVANDQEEFLLSSTFKRDSCMLLWSRTISNVLVFSTRRAAFEVISKLRSDRKLWIFEFFESEDKFILLSDDFNLPDWFKTT